MPAHLLRGELDRQKLIEENYFTSPTGFAQPIAHLFAKQWEELMHNYTSYPPFIFLSFSEVRILPFPKDDIDSEGSFFPQGL